MEYGSGWLVRKIQKERWISLLNLFAVRGVLWDKRGDEFVVRAIKDGKPGRFVIGINGNNEVCDIKKEDYDFWIDGLKPASVGVDSRLRDSRMERA